MRADRLLAVLLFLQAHGRVTAAQVAAELEVSVATARRDLEALSTAGVPVYPQPGRGGGWSLVGGARTDLTGLTAEETRALFLEMGARPVEQDRPDRPAARSALRKLLRAVPAPFREDAELAAGAVLTDQARWGEPEPVRTALARTVQDAVVARRRILLGYRSRGQAGARERLVDPWGVIEKGGVWYLIAGTEAGQRTFRLDRVTSAEVTGLAAAAPPEGFDLAEQWRQVVERAERQRSTVTATVLVPARYLPILRDHFGRHLQVEPRDPAARHAGASAGADTQRDPVRVRVAAQSPRSIAEQLAGWGAAVEVVGPQAVRAELARIGAELTARYSVPVTGPGS